MLLQFTKFSSIILIDTEKRNIYFLNVDILKKYSYSVKEFNTLLQCSLVHFHFIFTLNDNISRKYRKIFQCRLSWYSKRYIRARSVLQLNRFYYIRFYDRCKMRFRSDMDEIKSSFRHSLTIESDNKLP